MKACFFITLNLIIFIKSQVKKLLLGWRDGSAFKNIWHSGWRSGFSPSFHIMVHNNSTPVSIIWCLLLSTTFRYRYLWCRLHMWTNVHINKIKSKKSFKKKTILLLLKWISGEVDSILRSVLGASTNGGKDLIPIESIPYIFLQFDINYQA